MFPPEVEEGNYEYKRYLDPHFHFRCLKLKSQMLWRMAEGKRLTGVPEAVYYIGVEDNGELSNLSLPLLRSSLKVLSTIIEMANAYKLSEKITFYDIKTSGNAGATGVYAIVKIQKKPEDNQKQEEIRISLLGSTGGGKSTLVSVLTYGNLDNGKGSARSNIFRYDHEFHQGTTSSMKYEMIGYKDGKTVNYTNRFCDSWEDIVKKSDKLIIFTDLPGCPKYVKTTLFGILTYRPHYIIITVDLINPNLDETKMFLKLCTDLEIPAILVFTKHDLKTDLSIIISCLNDWKILPYNNDIDLSTTVPYLEISNVTGYNIDQLHQLLSCLNSVPLNTVAAGKLFRVNEVMKRTDNNVVLVGSVLSGEIKQGEKLLYGPIDNMLCEITIKSIHKRQVPNTILKEGETGTVVICSESYSELNYNKHTVIIGEDQIVNFINKFIIVLSEKDINFKDLQLMVHIGNVYDRVHITNQVTVNDKIYLSVNFCDNKIRYVVDNEPIIIRYNDKIYIGRAFQLNL